MTPSPAPNQPALADLILSVRPPEEEIRQRLLQIHQDVLAHSRYLRDPDFTAIHPSDLEFLFGAYDQHFFAGLCRPALEHNKLCFRLSRRLTLAGGQTARFKSRTGEVSFEISIAISMLFDGFTERDRKVTVGGLECKSRLEALQRIFEHEMVHLSEQLCWEDSNCSAPRFQDIAARLFLHQAHTHTLITRRERAAESGIRVGSRVQFTFEGRSLTGRVNRITKRATVLVEDPGGLAYTDGVRYKAYYVPITHLRPAHL